MKPIAMLQLLALMSGNVLLAACLNASPDSLGSVPPTARSVPVAVTGAPASQPRPTVEGNALRYAQPEIRLWPNGAPGSGGDTSPEEWMPTTDAFHRLTNINNPSILAFLPPKEKANGLAVIICPGGGHRYLVMDLEGSLVAERLNAMGIAGFVLKSRLAKAAGSMYTVQDSLHDAQRAMRVIRSRAAEWGIREDRVGIMGFSAGGEIAALAETQFEAVVANAGDPIDRFSSRPDFAVLGYAGIRAQNYTITKNTPPTFLVANKDDPSPAAAVAAYYPMLVAANVPAEAHVYPVGGHGFGMTGRSAAFQTQEVAQWPKAFEAWLRSTKLVAQ